MPQLDFALWPPQLIWLAISFIALYLIMAKVALPRISTVIELRRDRIAGDLDMAQGLKDKSEQARCDYEAALGQARGRAHEIAQETRDRLGSLTERQRSMSEAALASKIEDAEKSIARTKENVLAKLDDIATETAAGVVEALIGKKITAGKIKKAVKTVHKAQGGGGENG